MMCKNSFGTEWQQLHDHEREPGHDTNAQVGESASKCFVHFELADHQSASRWCWWFCTGSFVASSSLFFCDDISEIRMIQNRQDQQELIGKSLCCWSLFHIASMMMVLFCVCSSVRAASMTAALASINDRTRCLYRVRSSFDWTGRMLHRDHSSLPLAACLDVSYLWRRHRNTHIFFRDFQIIWHLAHMHQLALCMRGLRLSFTKVCEERHFWYQIKSVRMTQLLFSQTSIVGWSDCLFRDATVLM